MNQDPKSTNSILVVDDYAELREILADELKAQGFTVYEADGGKSALPIIQNNDIAVVVSDMNMPNGSGIDLLRNLRTRNQLHPPVIIITAYDNDTTFEAYRHGAVAVFTKPFFSSKNLISVIKRSMLPPKDSWRQPLQDNVIKKIQLEFDSLAVNFSSDNTKVSLGRGGLFIPFQEFNFKKNELVAVDLNFSNGPVKKLEFVGLVWFINQMPTETFPQGIGVEFCGMNEETILQVEALQNNSMVYLPAGPL